jgi:hypothetical protein
MFVLNTLLLDQYINFHNENKNGNSDIVKFKVKFWFAQNVKINLFVSNIQLKFE